MQRRNRIRGMLLGVVTGDALGGPHEFRNQMPISEYTGVLRHRITLTRQYQGGLLVGNVGQITDDTEMTIALARAIVELGRYDRNRAIMTYLAWANSKCWFMGRNTRALFVGVKTAKGYEGRLASQKVEPQSRWSQSNGCLMRCSPLATLPDAAWLEAVKQDCALTNFHPICIEAVTVYTCAARELLAGATPAAASERALRHALDPAVRTAAVEGITQQGRDVTDQKGWVLHALYCAFLALNDGRPSFEDRIDRVVRLGGDTDTNGAIAGALLGAQLGERAMLVEERTSKNIEIVLACDVTKGGLARVPKYAPGQLLDLADLLAALPQ